MSSSPDWTQIVEVTKLSEQPGPYIQQYRLTQHCIFMTWFFSQFLKLLYHEVYLLLPKPLPGEHSLSIFEKCWTKTQQIPYQYHKQHLVSALLKIYQQGLQHSIERWQMPNPPLCNRAHMIIESQLKRKIQLFPICQWNNDRPAGGISVERRGGRFSYPGSSCSNRCWNFVERSPTIVAWETWHLINKPQHKNWIFVFTISIPSLKQWGIVTSIFWQ